MDWENEKERWKGYFKLGTIRLDKGVLLTIIFLYDATIIGLFRYIKIQLEREV